MAVDTVLDWLFIAGGAWGLLGAFYPKSLFFDEHWNSRLKFTKEDEVRYRMYGFGMLILSIILVLIF
jgi:hypothetical protein